MGGAGGRSGQYYTATGRLVTRPASRASAASLSGLEAASDLRLARFKLAVGAAGRWVTVPVGPCPWRSP